VNSTCCAHHKKCGAPNEKEFEAKYPGVTVNYIRLSAGEAVTRLRNENPTRNSTFGGAARLIRPSPPKRKDC